MVYALKSYSNNKTYRREDGKNTLSALMSRFSPEARSNYTSYPNQRKTFLDKSVQNLAVNSIIEGYFPKENVVREMAIKRVNKMLCVMICALITVVIVSYYFVLSCEMKLNDLSRQTVILNNENTDLQNQLDKLKSFSNVDKTFQQNNMLKRAGQVIETQAVAPEAVDTRTTKSTKKRVFKYAIGF